MVQYIITPWRNQAELLKVRSQFYSQHKEEESKSTNDCEDEKQKQIDQEQKKEAVARVRLWMQRGNCPHLIESTAILTSAKLNDLRGGNESFCVRAVYAAAFSRFVTGLLDCHQDKRHKLSMYALAKTIGLPATFVELRHQATHEELPSLIRLQSATQKALQWIWGYYWVNLVEISSILSPTTAITSHSNHNPDSGCKTWLKNLLFQWNGNPHFSAEAALNDAKNLSKKWSNTCIMTALVEIQDSTDDVSILLQIAQLQATILGVRSACALPVQGKISIDDIHRELEVAKYDLSSPVVPISDEIKDGTPQSQKKGWVLYEGPWVPKPIGMT
ncbi:Pre-rRNA-processing protein las1 [Erysiphe necator]|nr:Pre-rRNA-processing protein las1 [Erysiphe necator]